jgi:type IV pilus assembly protein PilC
VPTFKYTAVTTDGQTIKDTAEASSSSFLENELLRRDLRVVRIAEKKSLAQIEITKERVKPEVVMHFSRQMAAFVRTGIPITEAIRIARDGADNNRFEGILADVEEALHGGVPFSQAIAQHRDVFPPYYVGILRSAELTGRLDTVLDQLSAYMERDLEARNRIRSALIYPILVLAMSAMTVGILCIFVLPKFVDLFESFDAELPATTRALLGFSGFVSSIWGLVTLLVVLGILLALNLWFRTPGGRRFKHRVLMRMPLVHEIVRFSAVERFCRVIAAMMQAGVPLPEAMSASIESVNNAVFEDGLRTAREAMIRGEGIAGPLNELDLLPMAAVQMIRVGEETGTLDQQIEGAANYYGTELEHKLKKLTSYFEPGIIVFMGLVVGFVAVALVQAMYGVYDGGALEE